MAGTQEAAPRGPTFAGQRPGHDVSVDEYETASETSSIYYSPRGFSIWYPSFYDEHFRAYDPDPIPLRRHPLKIVMILSDTARVVAEDAPWSDDLASEAEEPPPEITGSPTPGVHDDPMSVSSPTPDRQQVVWFPSEDSPPVLVNNRFSTLPVLNVPFPGWGHQVTGRTIHQPSNQGTETPGAHSLDSLEEFRVGLAPRPPQDQQIDSDEDLPTTPRRLVGYPVGATPLPVVPIEDGPDPLLSSSDDERPYVRGRYSDYDSDSPPDSARTTDSQVAEISYLLTQLGTRRTRPGAASAELPSVYADDVVVRAETEAAATTAFSNAVRRVQPRAPGRDGLYIDIRNAFPSNAWLVPVPGPLDDPDLTVSPPAGSPRYDEVD